MQDYRFNEPITYVANGIRLSGGASATDTHLTEFGTAIASHRSWDSIAVFLRDDNFNEVDYVNWRIGRWNNGTRIRPHLRIAFGLALAQPFEEPTLYEYSISGYTDSMVELIPFVGQLYGGDGLSNITDGALNNWNGSQSGPSDRAPQFNYVEYHILPSEHSKGFSVSAEGLIAMHESYGPSWTNGYYMNNRPSPYSGTRDSPVIIGVMAVNDTASRQNMKNTDISISGRRVPHSETADFKDRRPQ